MEVVKKSDEIRFAEKRDFIGIILLLLGVFLSIKFVSFGTALGKLGGLWFLAFGIKGLLEKKFTVITSGVTLMYIFPFGAEYKTYEGNESIMYSLGFCAAGLAFLVVASMVYNANFPYI